jgi:hypothetical protein
MNDKVLVACASYNRPYVFEKDTLFWLKQLKKYPWIVCVEPQQKLHYGMVVPRKNLITSSTDCWQCGQLLRIRDYAKEHGFKYVLKVDDDTWFTDRQNTRKADAAIVIERHLDDIVPLIAERPDVGAVGFIKIRSLLFNTENKRFLKYNRYLVSAYLIDVDCWDYPHKIWGFDDLWTTLNVTQTFGRKIPLYGLMAMNAVAEANDGGLQSKDGLSGRDALAKLDLQLMQSTFPNLTVRTDSINKTLDVDISAYVNTVRMEPDDSLNQP